MESMQTSIPEMCLNPSPGFLLTTESGYLISSSEAEFSNSHSSNNAYLINTFLECNMIMCAQYLVLSI